MIPNKLLSSYVLTGVPHLDKLLGGGLPVGSINLVETDFHSTYAKLFMNLFIAEGIVSGQGLLFGGIEDIKNLLSKLPNSVESENVVISDSMPLKIAWRYQDLPNLEKSDCNKIDRYFDLSQVMDAESLINLHNIQIVDFKPDATKPFLKYYTDFQKKHTNKARRIDSVSWGYSENISYKWKLILKFICLLHSALQNTPNVVYITMNPIISSNVLPRLYHYCDYVFEINGFDGTPNRNNVYNDYDGLFTVVHAPWLGVFPELSTKQTTLEWCFKVKRRQLIVQMTYSMPDESQNLMVPPEQFDPSLAPDYYHTGGYWFVNSQAMNILHPSDRIMDIVFDPLEELIWCITQAGQLTAFYTTTMERYISVTIPILSELPNSHFKQVLPSSRTEKHCVFVLSDNALHAYTKHGKPLALVSHPNMLDLECMAATGTNDCLVGSNNWSGLGNLTRFFVGGLQPYVFELDALERWGEVISTIDVGVGGAVVLRPFTSGLCAGNANGSVMLIDSRTRNGVVREIQAHSGEISDITVDGNGHTLVTCGWSRVGDNGLRVDRLLRVYDLRSGRAQIPLSASLDPCFARFPPGCSDHLLIASQTGSIQTIQWGKTSFSPDDLGQLWLSYDRLSSLDISQNGNCVFATEGGQIQLYLKDLNSHQFNMAPLHTEFASNYAESLCSTNYINGTISTNANIESFDDSNSNLCGTNIATIGKNIADSIKYQYSNSFHQPEKFMSSGAANEDEAVLEIMKLAYKPVDFEDYRFSFSNVLFISEPPFITGVSSMDEAKLDGFCTSDWPMDLLSPKPRLMKSVDSELLSSANSKHAVRKPPDWGSVWHPYDRLSIPLNDLKPDNAKPEFGRFVDCSHKNVD